MYDLSTGLYNKYYVVRQLYAPPTASPPALVTGAHSACTALTHALAVSQIDTTSPPPSRRRSDVASRWSARVGGRALSPLHHELHGIHATQLVKASGLSVRSGGSPFPSIVNLDVGPCSLLAKVTSSHRWARRPPTALDEASSHVAADCSSLIIP